MFADLSSPLSEINVIVTVKAKMRGLDCSWTGEQSILDTKCLAEKNGGLYITAETEEELIVALEKTLSCPMVTQGPLP